MLFKWMVAAAAALSVLGSTQCSMKPGPISVHNEISPSTVQSGALVEWKITVTNYGGKVKIERIHCKEECIEGWAAGTVECEIDLPLSNAEVAAKQTEVVHAQTSPVLNIGPTDIVIKNTVTVYSNGGTDTDFTTYKILRARMSDAPPSARGLIE